MRISLIAQSIFVYALLFSANLIRLKLLCPDIIKSLKLQLKKYALPYAVTWMGKPLFLYFFKI